MASHTRQVDNRISGPLVPGDDYTVVLSGGIYEFTAYASDWGAGTGITLYRLMPDGTTLLELISQTADDVPSVFYLASGRAVITADSDVADPQVVFGKI